jgi:hypothetical protein
MGFSAGPGVTLNGHNLMSLWTEASLNRLPINLLASETEKRQILYEQQLAGVHDFGMRFPIFPIQHHILATPYVTQKPNK